MLRPIFTRCSPCTRLLSPPHAFKAFMSSSTGRRPLNPRFPPQGDSVQLTRANSVNGDSFSSPRAFRRKEIEPRHPPREVHLNKTLSLRWSDVHQYLASNVGDWASREPVRIRLVEYGLPSEDVRQALSIFATYMQNNDVPSELSYSQEQLEAIAEDLSNPNSGTSLDVQFTRLFFEWASDPIGRAALEPQIPEYTLFKISSLFDAADVSQPALDFNNTCCAPRRKFIMHVGPTNSGKTHNALRALAAARSGVYCGPLRLLAFEIWDRLNKGNIVPLGHDTQTSAEEDTDTNFDATMPGETPAVQKQSNPKFARLCNLITGDDRRIVNENAGLLSCTVEMLPRRYFDVAVIDEIQLLTDPERGWSWTEAILKVNAPEIHLCGEESAVPLVQRILQDTGDILEINRYSRLTPLVVSESSLAGDLSKIEKGDCVVAFSRREIFDLRNVIEAKTGLRCAVVYGKLPPELRNQQAILFNDPQNDIDVLIGSDAVGMGLNLKIKRLVFNATWKWDGKEETPLSTRHLKQIAGRAGRFGLHAGNSSGGVVTAVHEKSMDAIREALAAPAERLRKARFQPSTEQVQGLVNVLPTHLPLSTVFSVFHFIGKHHPAYELQDTFKPAQAMQRIDDICGGLAIVYRFLLRQAPIRWRDHVSLPFIECMLRIFRDSLLVKLDTFVKATRILKALKNAESLMEQDKAFELHRALPTLEGIHSTLVTYIWLSYRLPISFPDLQQATALKEQFETVMSWCLEQRSGHSTSSSRSRYQSPYWMNKTTNRSPKYTRDQGRHKATPVFGDVYS